jgi:hypothetical protein
MWAVSATAVALWAVGMPLVSEANVVARGALVVEPTTVPIGGRLIVSNAGDADSRCASGVAVLEPFGVYMSSFFNADSNGQWSTEIEVTPTWGVDNNAGTPRPRVTQPGTYTVTAECSVSEIVPQGASLEEGTDTASTTDGGPFTYVPFTVEVVAADSSSPADPANPETAASVDEVVIAKPTFTG